MKNRNWLDISEYALLLGSGVGTVASIASQQIAYTAAPLSFLMVLNVLNRRRLLQELEQNTASKLLQLDQRISPNLEALRLKVQVMPEMADINNLKKSLIRQERKLTEQMAEKIAQVQQETTEQLAPLQEHNLQLISQDIHQLQIQGNRLRESLSEIATYQHRLATNARVDALISSSTQVTEELTELKTELALLQSSFQSLLDDQKVINPRTLQEQIDHLNRRLSNLPQSFDASALKQDVESLLNVVTDLVSRREFARVLTDVERLNQQCHELDQSTRLSRLSNLIFRKQLETLSNQLNTREEAIDWMSSAIFQPGQTVPDEVEERLTHLTRNLHRLEERLNQRPADGTDPEALRLEIQQAIATQIAELQHQLTSVQQSTQVLEQGQATLQHQVNSLPPANDNHPLQTQLLSLTARIEGTETSLGQLVNSLPPALDMMPLENQLHQLTSRVEGAEASLSQLQRQIEQDIRHHLTTALEQVTTRPAAVVEETLAEFGDHFSVQEGSPLEEGRQELQATIATQVQELQNQVQDLQNLIHTLEQQSPLGVNQGQETPDLAPLQHQLGQLADRLELAEFNLGNLQGRIEETIRYHLEQFRHQLPTASAQPAPHTLEEFAQGFTESPPVDAQQANSVALLQQQFASLQALIQKLEQEQTRLHEQAQVATNDGSSQQELQVLTTRLAQAENLLNQIQSRLEAAMATPEPANSPTGTANHELLFDLKRRTLQVDRAETPTGSRSVLEAALARVQERIVIVWPWPSADNLDEALMQQFEDLLQRGVSIDIGWGHLGDPTQIRQPRLIGQPKPIDAAGRGFLYSTLKRLAQLKEKHPRQFGFKILGTYENFLVCDRAFAVLSVHPVPTASSVFPELSMGLRSRDPQVIQSLLNRFDQPILDPANANAYFNRATTRYDLGDRQGAIADYTQVIQINPEDEVAYNNRSLAYYELGDRGKAMADLDRALQINSQNPTFYFNRGFVQTEGGDKLGAVADYGRALQLQPDFALAYLYRGLTRTRLGNRPGAIDDYSTALRLNPQDAMAHLYRGLAYFKQGERGNAAEDLREAARLFAERKDRVNRQRALDALGELERVLTASLG